MDSEMLKTEIMMEAVGGREYLLEQRSECKPWPVCSVVRVLAYVPRGLRFDSYSKTCNWIAGSITGPDWGECGRQ